MDINAIPEKEAAKILGVSLRTIQNAVKRGDLLGVPQNGIVQHVAKEQVDLYLNKPSHRIVRSVLTREELTRWEAINIAISHSQPNIQTTPSYVVRMDANQFVKALLDNGVVSPGNQLTFQSALADETDSTEQAQDVNIPGFALVLLLGLLVLFYVQAVHDRAVEASIQAEKTINKIGLVKEDLVTNRREAIAKIQNNPHEAQQIKHILERENLLAA
jgi:hypothetical protein